ncbi:hypothetical protein E2C01_038676 [Portunus trituberculatus]|uniref:Uncharacterized protein n=1 Tax=Portunus trituberculatus TaxID=210409 RepID=A0A5B7FIM9_PORTR|nr:hypothetical protein [Portunus trituberculatus]
MKFERKVGVMVEHLLVPIPCIFLCHSHPLQLSSHSNLHLTLCLPIIFNEWLDPREDQDEPDRTPSIMPPTHAHELIIERKHFISANMDARSVWGHSNSFLRVKHFWDAWLRVECGSRGREGGCVVAGRLSRQDYCVRRGKPGVRW